MKLFNKIKSIVLLTATAGLILTACNKAPLDPVPLAQPAQGTSPTLATLLDDPNFSIFKEAVKKAGLLSTLSVPTLRFTVFAPDNAADQSGQCPQMACGMPFCLRHEAHKSLLYGTITAVIVGHEEPLSSCGENKEYLMTQSPDFL